MCRRGIKFKNQGDRKEALKRGLFLSAVTLHPQKTLRNNDFW
jgi:hypothetical protein